MRGHRPACRAALRRRAGRRGAATARRAGGTTAAAAGLGLGALRARRVDRFAAGVAGAVPDLPHVAPDRVEKATGRLLAVRSVRDDGVTSSKHRFFAGQVLYAKIRPNLSKVVRVDFDGLCSADMYPLTPRIDARYFHIFLLSRTFRDQVVQADHRLTVPKVNQAQLLATLVAVPPPGAQRRIADEVDRLMALCDELERELQRQEQHAAALADAVIAGVVGPG